MYIFAHLMLVAAFLTAVFFSAAAAAQLWQKDRAALPLVEKGGCAVAILISASSLCLTFALATNDYSLDYAARHSDNLLPLFNRLTAFWAGQEGSLLFWSWSAALFGVFFLLSRSYSLLSAETRLWFWMFYLAALAFFLLLLSGWNNPFVTLGAPPADGAGLNPQLRNPGMIFHPPLLFLGYGAFLPPACLALAQALSRERSEEIPWLTAARPFALLAWALLSAGIILGAWWAYAELGWGGYWAWDAVENASLVPWLFATAFLHTSAAENRLGLLRRCNVLLISLTAISTFAGAYIARGGALKSVHAYSGGGVGTLLLVFIAVFSGLAVLASVLNNPRSNRLHEPASREGALSLAGALLLVLALVVLAATFWPLLSKMWSPTPQALLPTFYNRVCLPVFLLLILLLAFCPWLARGEERREFSGPAPAAERKSVFTSRRAVRLIALCFALGIPVFWFLMEAPAEGGFMRRLQALLAAPPRQPLAKLSAAAATAGVFSLVLLLLIRPRFFRLRNRLAACGAHLGFLLMALGIAFSGPYRLERTLNMGIGQSERLGAYEITLMNVYKGMAPDYSFYGAEMSVRRQGGDSVPLLSERRAYAKFPGSVSETDTLFSLGSEPGATLLGVDEQSGVARIRLLLSPLVNWIWIGGLLLCVFPLLAMLGRNRRQY